MQGTAQGFGSTEEDTSFGRRMNLADAAEDGIPIGSAKVGGSPETCNGIELAVGTVEHDVGSIIALDLGGQVLVVVSIP